MTEYFVRLVNFMTISRDEEKGATAVEYGLLVSLIALVITVGMTALAGGLNGLFNAAAAAL
jgi:pilus assembly protein Flp/PilA